MLSKQNVKDAINNAEQKYLECWNILCLFRSSTTKELDFNKIMEFQPILAQTLFSLDKFYRDLHQEKLSVIERKDCLTPKWFTNRLRLLDNYQEAIKDTISIGKSLGDAFAWTFYSKEQKYISKHSEHSLIFHTPPGIGGQGELEFIKKGQILNGDFLIYHQITTFLRLGDVSIFDVGKEKFGLKALGEIKTKKISDNELSVSLTIIGPPENFSFDKEKISVNHNTSEKAFIQDFTPPIQNKLKKQMRSMSKSFSVPEVGKTEHVEIDFYFSQFEQLLEELEDSPVAHTFLGEGLLLIGMRNNKGTLSSKLFEEKEMGKAIEKKLDHLPELIQNIIKNERKELNSLTIYSLHTPNPKTQLQAGMTPLFWWPVPYKFLRKIYFHDALVFGLYNPAYFILELEKIGLEVLHNRETNRYTAYKKNGEQNIEIKNFQYFINLIAVQMFPEKHVINMIRKITQVMEDKIQSGEIQEYDRMGINIFQFL